jgi:hypothetical protein
LAVIVERAVDLLFDDTMKQRFAQTRSGKKPHSVKQPSSANRTHAAKQTRCVEQTRSVEQPRSANRTRAAKRTRARRANSRYIPRAVLRAVHQRDGGQCTFVSADGKRCSERSFLELHHHEQPYARGGEATVENLRLTCRAHNALYAERDYGRTFMRSKRMNARDRSTNSSQNESKFDPSCSPSAPSDDQACEACHEAP